MVAAGHRRLAVPQASPVPAVLAVLAIVAATLVVAQTIFSDAAQAQADTGPVVISEFLASNPGPHEDGDGDSSDWIELHNASESPVNLEGWELVDDSNIWSFPARELGPGDRLVVFASSKNRVDPSAELHTNFKLSATGEDLLLRDASGATASAYLPFPAQSSGVSYGISSSGEVGPLLSATPGRANSALGASAAPPTAAVGRSIQATGFVETLSSATPEATIRYTLDGSDPSSSSAEAVDGRIQIDPTDAGLTRIRARSFAPGLAASEIVQFTYVNPDRAASEIGGGAAVADSIEALPIIVLGTATGVEPQRPATVTSSTPYEAGNVEYIDGQAGFATDVGTRLFGNFSAFYPGWSKLSYRVKFDGEWGDDLDYPVFAGRGNEMFEPPTSFDKLELRGFSNDGMAVSAAGTYISNEFARTLLHDLGSPSTHYRYVNLFMNGEYRGVYSMRERVGDAWLADEYGGQEDDYEWVTRTNSFEVKNGTGAVDNAVRTGNWDRARDLVNPDAFINAALALTWTANYNHYENEWHLVSPIDPDHPRGMIPFPNDVDAMLGHRYNQGRSDTYQFRIAAWVRDDEFKNILWDRAARAFCGDGEMTPNRLEARAAQIAAELRPAMAGEMAALANLGFRNRTVAQWETNIATAITRAGDGADIRSSWQSVGWFGGCNRAPVVTAPTQALSAVGQPFALAVEAADDTVVSFTATDLPPGLAIDATTGMISGTPTTAGAYQTTIDATDADDLYTRHRIDWTVHTANPAGLADPPIVLNEYNAVSATLGWHGSNSTSPAGFDPPTNGGDWIELLVRHDHLDLRGFTIELLDRDDRFARLESRELFEFSNSDTLSDLRTGTIITIAESIPEDRTYDPATGDWHINVNSSTAHAGGLLTSTSRSNFGTNADSLHVIVRNPAGQITAPILGETDTWSALGDDVDAASILELCTTLPGATLAEYQVSTTRSSFGEPNDCGHHDGSGRTQPVDALRATVIVTGDADCDGSRGLMDALAVAQHHHGARPGGECDPTRPDQVNISAADLDADGQLTPDDIGQLLTCLIDPENCS